MKKTSVIYKIIAVLILVFLTVPILVNHIPGVPKAHVFGVENKPLAQKISWKDGTAQQAFEKEAMEHSVLRTYLLRFRNQYQYTLFDKINASDIYDYDGYYFRFYVPAFNEELNFVGKDSIENTLNAIVRLQELTGDSIPIITIIPASKNHYYKNRLPSKNQTTTQHTNYRYVLSGLNERKLPYIDFNNYFCHHPSEVPAIFAKQGIHWTHYAATVASDSIMRFVDQLKGTQYDSFEFDAVDANGFNVDDLDLALLRNLLVKPKDDNLRNVVIHPKKGQKRLNAVIIGDSYFLAIQNSGARHAMFTKGSNYHYYFNRTYNDMYREIPFDIQQIKKEIEKADCILLINDITNLEIFGFGFPQKMVQLFQK
jgi:hypothetical protein